MRARQRACIGWDRTVDSTAYLRWIEASARRGAVRAVLGAVGLLLGAMAMLGLAVVVTWFSLNILFLWLELESHQLELVACIAIVFAFFVAGIAADTAAEQPIAVPTGPDPDDVVLLHGPAVEDASRPHPMVPEELWTMSGCAKSIAVLAPRMLTGSGQLLWKARRLASLDAPACAAVLADLHAHPRRRSFEALRQDIAGFNLTVAFASLQDIDGVLFLLSEPPGLALTAELREELDATIGI